MVTGDQLKARRHAREILGEMRWRGMTVPPLYARMAGEFQDLVRSGDYAAWVTASQKPAVMDRRSHVAGALSPVGPGAVGSAGDVSGSADGHPARRPPGRAAAVA
jgi:hypothetical protein